MSFSEIFKNKELIDSFADRLSGPLVFLSYDGKIQAANDFFLKIMQMDSNSYLGINFREFCKEHNFLLTRLINKDKFSIRKSIEESYPIGRNKATIKWERINLCEADYKQGFFLIGYNITKVSRVRERLKEEVLFYENILSKLPTNVYWKDKNLIYRGCNDRLARVMGLSSRHAINGMSDFDFDWGRDVAQSFVKFDKKVMQTGQELTTEDIFKENDGNAVTVLTNKTPLINQEGEITGILAISVDITDKKKTESDLLKAKEKAESASQAKSKFIANMSHDIRTPLTGLLGMAQAIESTSADEEIRKDSALLIICAEELLNLFNEIIELVQIESGNTQQKEEAFSLIKLFHHNVNLLGPAAKNKNITLDLHLDSKVPHYVYGNKILLSRILLNLLSNAIKFTNEGGVTLTVLCPNMLNDCYCQLEILVKDTGIGIPKDKIDFIFEHFSRVSSAYQGIYKGSGLGLYTVERYLELLKGNITIESEVGKGSCFCVKLPLRIVDNPLLEKENFQEKELKINSSMLLQRLQLDLEKDLMSTDQNQVHVLLVEDQPIIAKIAANILKKTGCSIDHVNRGKKALAMLDKKHYDLIYMDIGLPDLSGLEVTKRVRFQSDGINVKTPIVALTAHMNEKSNYNECLKSGMQEMLTKPLTTLKAEAIIKKYVYKIEEKEEGEIMDKLSDIDFEQGANLVNGNNEIAKEMVDMLAKTLPGDFEAIKKAYHKKDWDEVYNTTHYLYGSLCYCGVPKLQGAGNLLQEAAKTKKKLLIDLAYKELECAMKEFLLAYKQL